MKSKIYHFISTIMLFVPWSIFLFTHECLGASVSGGRNFHFLLRCFYDFLRYFHYLGICQRTCAGFVDANLLCHQWTLWRSWDWGILPDGDFVKKAFPAILPPVGCLLPATPYNKPIF